MANYSWKWNWIRNAKYVAMTEMWDQLNGNVLGLMW